MTKVVLINPMNPTVEIYEQQDYEYGKLCIPFLGILYIAAYIRENNYEVGIIDGQYYHAIGQDYKQKILHEYEKNGVNIFGINCCVITYKVVLEIAEFIKREIPNSIVVIGGPHATLDPSSLTDEQYMDFIDIIAIGEGEETWVEILKAYNSEMKDFSSVKGIYYKAENQWIKTDAREFNMNLDKLPFPAKDLLDGNAYRDFGTIISGRGCPGKCIYCAAAPLSGSRQRCRSIDNVILEIKECIQRHDLDHIFIVDDTFTVMTTIDEQSVDIARGVDMALEIKEQNIDRAGIEVTGAGDQGMMFGFATDETEEYLPYPIALAHKLAQCLAKIRKDGTLPYLRPDGKTQVTVEYNELLEPIRIDAVVLSTQHDDVVSQEEIHKDIKKYVFDSILPRNMVDDNTKFFINPTGRFVVGGPHGDSGLTGRKIIVDTYGGYSRHGGGAFSGKDCTKVDRSAAYAARYVAKNIVAAGLARRCEIQLSYAIGVAQPTSIMVDTFGTGKVRDDKLVDIIRKNFDLTPTGIIEMLNLRRPIYKQTASYGHFGRKELDLPWEKVDRIDQLKAFY